MIIVEAPEDGVLLQASSALIAHLFEDLTALERFQASAAKRREAEAMRAGGGRDSGDLSLKQRAHGSELHGRAIHGRPITFEPRQDRCQKVERNYPSAGTTL
jgi:hypothetical protein